MFVILAYDVKAKKCNKILRICRKYLIHTQFSFFEGDISEKNLREMISQLEKKIDKKDGDTIQIYKFPHGKLFKRETLGQKKEYPGESIFL